MGLESLCYGFRGTGTGTPRGLLDGVHVTTVWWLCHLLSMHFCYNHTRYAQWDLETLQCPLWGRLSVKQSSSSLFSLFGAPPPSIPCLSCLFFPNFSVHMLNVCRTKSGAAIGDLSAGMETRSSRVHDPRGNLPKGFR